MDIWTATRTVLEKSPNIQAKYLIDKLRKKTGLSRSTIYEHLNSFALRQKIYREKGHYWLDKPEALKQARVSENHAINIALGLKFWLSESEEWHDVEGLKPRRDYKYFAIQHLEAYPEIYSKLPSDIFFRLLTPDNFDELSKKIKTVNIYFEIEEIEGRLRKSLRKKFEERDLSHNYLHQLIDTIARARAQPMYDPAV